MRRFLAALGVTTFLAVGLCAVNPAAASQEPLMTGAVTQFNQHEVNMSSHGVFAAATGEVTYATFFHAAVTCLEVTGNDGKATAVIDSSHDPAFPVGETVVAEGVDNGNPGTNDLFRLSFESNGGIVSDTAHPGCSLPVFPPVPIQSGDIQVMAGS